MKHQITILSVLFLLPIIVFAQNLTQTVRGTILDIDSKIALIGAQVVVVGSEPLIGATTDYDGKFRLENVPVGRIALQLSYLGYEHKTIPNIVVNSGKEVVLNLNMQESSLELEEIVVKVNRDKGEAVNDMSLISTRAISAEETERFAGGFNDPSRIVSSFAGVATVNDGDNSIIVRGNSPKYMQWRLEGMEITNPNHFADQNSISGGISALNNNLLATSDFSTGAFSPEYGDALSGVYDLKLRAGNNEKFESTFGFGLLGTDITLEGPFKKGYGGSFLVNYRYSTISMISDFGLVDIDGLLNFQDAAFKVVLPTKKFGVFSMFGLGGASNFLLEDVKRDLWATPGDEISNIELNEDYEKKALLLNTGINHTLPLSKRSYLKTAFSFASNSINDDVFETRRIKTINNEGETLSDSISNKQLDFSSKLRKSTYRGAITYNNKLNAKNKIQVGTRYSLMDFDNNESWLQEERGTRFTAIDFNENISTIRNFVSWKHRLNEKVTIVSGIHNVNVLFNNKSTFEPRIAFNWKLNNTNEINAGYGSHSTMESVHNYFTKVELEDGSIVEPNKDLGLLKAHHFVLGYQKRFNKNLSAKVELYYQDLYNLPVENNDTSYYATINEGLEFQYVDLVNEGTGKNYGVEFTLERFFDNNYYYMVNASLFQSKYKSLEGVERNTIYNGNYLVNILLGKEFERISKKKNKTLTLNAKIFFGGGKKQLPLLRDEEGNLAVNPAQNQYYDYSKAYEDKLEDIYSVIVSASYKINRDKATHEIFLNLDNVTNTKGRLLEYYDAEEPNSVGHLKQFGFFPNLMYRVYF